jgi:hypothetical protein
VPKIPGAELRYGNFIQPIADALDRLDAGTECSKFNAKTAQMLIKSAGDQGLTPDFFKQSFTIKDGPVILHKKLEKAKFDHCQSDRVVLNGHFMSDGIECQFPHGDFLPGREFVCGALQGTPYTQYEFLGIVRFGDVIIRSQFEALNPVLISRYSAQHDDWNMVRRGSLLQQTA